MIDGSAMGMAIRLEFGDLTRSAPRSQGIAIATKRQTEYCDRPSLVNMP